MQFQPGDILIINLVVTVAALLQGSIGLGLGLLAAPILVMYYPNFVPGPMLLAGLILSVLILWRERVAVDFFGLKLAIPGRILGTLIGAGIFVKVRGPSLSLFLGIVVIVVVIFSFFRSSLKPTGRNLVIAGVLSGIMATTTSIGGPPIGLVYQNSDGATIRSTLAGYFIFGTTFSLVTLFVVNGFGLQELTLTVLFLPGLLLGFVLSRYRSSKLDTGYIRYAILVISLIAGLILIFREIY